MPEDPAQGPEACLPGCESGQPCDDGDPCTTSDRCEAGVCRGDPYPQPCDDGDACTVDLCDGLGGCSTAPVDCDDADPCTLDLCDPVLGCQSSAVPDPPPEGPALDPSCANLVDDDCDGLTDGADPDCVSCAVSNDCDDSDPCTLDSCVSGRCESAPLANGHACDDGDPCTVGESCQAGLCQGGLLPDADGDGYPASACGGDDCDDADTAVNPGAVEGGPGASSCQDGADNDCDGATDGLDPECAAGPTVGPLCAPAGWCWEHPLPQGNDLVGLWGQGTQAWAVGPNGIILRIEVTGLTLEPIGSFADLRAIHGAGSQVVAVGGNHAYQTTGGSWLEVVWQQEVDDFRDVWVESTGDFWMAGTAGSLFLHRAGTTSAHSAPSQADLLAVSAVDGIPWVADSLGKRHRFAGTAWVDVTANSGATLVRDLAVYRSTGGTQDVEALAVGGGGRIARFTGADWSTELPAGPELHGLCWEPAAGGLAAGDGVVWAQNDPTSGSWSPQIDQPDAWRGAWSPTGPNGMGEVLAVGLRGAMIGTTGGVSVSTLRRFDEDLYAVSCLPSQAWGVGAQGRYVKMEMDAYGQPAWSQGAAGSADLLAVWGDEGGLAWAVGPGGIVYRLETEVAFPETSGVGQTLRAVSGVLADVGVLELWAFGDGGTAVRRVDADWSTVVSATGANLHAAHAFGSEVWVVGDQGTVLRCGASSCYQENSVTDSSGNPAPLRAVFMTSAEEGYAGAEDGSIYRREPVSGWSWVAQPAPGRPIRALSARWIEGAGWDVWAVGDRGLALNLSPIGMPGWHQVQIGANVDLHGLCAWSPAFPPGSRASLRAVGAGGASLILR